MLGSRRLYITLADGSTPLTGSAESLWKTMLSAERPALDFEWAPTARRFKSRKTVERTRSPAGKTDDLFPASVLDRFSASSFSCCTGDERRGGGAPQEWVIQEAAGGKVAEIKESEVQDMWGRPFLGWTVALAPSKMQLLEPIIPGALLFTPICWSSSVDDLTCEDEAIRVSTLRYLKD